MSDEALEAAIDRAGRAKVFALMRAAGWTGYDMPPKWCWRVAVNEVEARPTTPPHAAPAQT